MNLTTKEYLLAWLESLRVKTLLLAFSSVVLGSALALAKGELHGGIALLTLLTAGLLQILSNLANDYGDMSKGTDTEIRLGPKRGMQKGIINIQQMQRMLCIVIGLTICSGIMLIVSSCHTIADFLGFLFLGGMAIIAAITYTVGRHAYGYVGLGDFSVLIFFGWLGVIGSYYLQTHHLGWQVFIPASACGLLAVAVLNINNLRDIESDRLTGKRTLVVRLGQVYAKRYHAMLLILSLLLFGLFSFFEIGKIFGWLFLVMIPFIYYHMNYVFSHHNAEEMCPLLGSMVKIAVLVNLFFSLGVVITA